MPSLHRGRRSCRHRLVPAASSSEPPTSVGLACRPVGASRRQLMKPLSCTRRSLDLFPGAAIHSGVDAGLGISVFTYNPQQVDHELMRSQELAVIDFRLMPGAAVLGAPARRLPAASLITSRSAWASRSTAALIAAVSDRRCVQTCCVLTIPRRPASGTEPGCLA
jgi:hypothetical protein